MLGANLGSVLYGDVSVMYIDDEQRYYKHITITRLCNILQFFTAVKSDNFQIKNCDIFSYFC